MFCNNCGTAIDEGAKFCTNCGKEASEATKEILRPNAMVYAVPYRSKNSLQIKIVAISILIVVAVVALVLLLQGNSNRTDFNIKYTPDDIERFLNIVCKNVEGDYAKVTDPNYDGPAAGHCYTAEMGIKLPGKIEEYVQMRFYNQDDSDMVAYGEMIFHDYDSENEFNCEVAFLVALEKTLSGSSCVEDYITSYDDMENIAFSMDNLESRIIGAYWLTEDLQVTIVCEHSFSWDWYLYYKITKK